MEIWKYILAANSNMIVEMPKEAEILTAQEQFGEICIWALVNPILPKEKREFVVYGTGHKIIYEREELDYIGTVQLYKGSLVLHVFECIEINKQ